jgi:uncharacterized protein YndB with AHSA1/START domain
MKVLKRILIALAVLILLFLGLVAIQPADFKITRSAAIAAPPNIVFAQVNDFHKWEAWSPWLKLDPAAKSTYAGAPAGTGAEFAWAGNDKIGEGKMAITESRPNDLIRIKLDFIKPMEGTCTTEFNFKSQGDRTSVTWSMIGRHTFVEKGFCLFMNIDKMVGGDFEKGLAQMKAIAEAAAKNQRAGGGIVNDSAN